MILGVLSDSHGQHARTRAAVELLERLGAEAFVHCGDLGGRRVLDALAGRRAWFVWGNTDFPDPSLVSFAKTIGVNPPGRVPLRIELARRTVLVFHGHEVSFLCLARLAERGDVAGFEAAVGQADYVLFGHSHHAYDARIGRIRLVNPGALQRAATYSVATIDLEYDTVEHWVVDENADPLIPPFKHDA